MVIKIIIFITLTISFISSAPLQTIAKSDINLPQFIENSAVGKLLDKKTFIKLFNVKTQNLDAENNTVSNQKTKRYAFFGSPWSVKQLTYRITKYSTKLNKEIIDKTIAHAFRIWSQHIDLKFIAKRMGPVDIDIRFVENEHGDGFPFDGPGGVLAHATAPSTGFVHFDDNENWSLNNTPYLLQTAVHEIGHSIGMAHSEIGSAAMSPHHPGFNPNFHLDFDDIKGIQKLYGTKIISPNLPWFQFKKNFG